MEPAGRAYPARSRGVPDLPWGATCGRFRAERTGVEIWQVLGGGDESGVCGVVCSATRHAARATGAGYDPTGL